MYKPYNHQHCALHKALVNLCSRHCLYNHHPTSLFYFLHHTHTSTLKHSNSQTNTAQLPIPISSPTINNQENQQPSPTDLRSSNMSHRSTNEMSRGTTGRDSSSGMSREMTLSRPSGSSRSRDTRSRDDDRYGNSYHRREDFDFDNDRVRAAERQASAVFNTARAAGMRPRLGMAYILEDDGTVREESGDRYLENYEGSGARGHGSSSGRHEGASNNSRSMDHDSGSSSRRLEAPSSSSSRREDNMQLAVYGDRSSHASSRPSRSSNGHSRSSHSGDDRDSRSSRRDTESRRY